MTRMLLNPREGREVERVREAWTGPKATVPVPFVLVGYENEYVFPVAGEHPLVIDADGVVFLSGEVFTWCRSGCCATNPRRWASVKQAAEAHGSYVVSADGSVRDPAALDPDLGSDLEG